MSPKLDTPPPPTTTLTLSTMSNFSSPNDAPSDRIDHNASSWGSFSYNDNKRLRLFGFELIKPTCNNNNDSEVDRDESVNSSDTAVSILTPREQQVKVWLEDRRPLSSDVKKLRCQLCFKEFANSQALGGHQNAHKKERLKRKRLQLQAQRVGLHQYLIQPLHNNPSFVINFRNGASATPSWFFDASRNMDQFRLYDDEPQRSFSLPMPANTISCQQDYSCTDLDRTRGETPLAAVVVKPSAFQGSKLSCKSLDLKLGLNLKSNIPNSA